MDERIISLETSLLTLRAAVDSSSEQHILALGVLTAALDDIKADASLVDEVERLRSLVSTLEAQVGYLSEERDAALADSDLSRTHAEMLLAKASSMREAIVRYAVACGTVDVQTALLRRDPSDQTPARVAELQRAMVEEKESSEALRDLAQNL